MREEPAAVSPGLVLARIAAILLILGILLLAPGSRYPMLTVLLALLLLLIVLAAFPRHGHLAANRGETARSEPVLGDGRLNAVLDAISAPTVLIDRRGIVMHGNAAAFAAFPGLRNDHPVAFGIRAPDMIAAIEAVIRAEPEAHATIIDRVPVERSFDVLIRRLALEPDGRRPPVGAPFAVIFMQDTTDARRLEAMRVDFVANASHELRTPLASILGFIETLQGAARNDPQARTAFLAIMEAQARRMARLIEDLLSLSKIELSAHIPPSDPVDLALLVRSVCDALGGLARDRGVTLVLDVPEAPMVVIGDRDELVRVIENLVENGIKYGQSGGRVEIRMSRTDAPEEGVLLAVRDFGPGIAAEHLPRLTERFYRADVNESRDQGGTGLGLAIVKHIVTRHRGRLAIDSRLGEGSTFTIILPGKRDLPET
ncbi:MAG: two-component sensor histidine kinase [Hyphomicrobiales bacterium]|nr:two-component sensor histidine kinase [Hyphomicrobiales bacterium]